MSYNNYFKEIESYSKSVWKKLNVYETKIDHSKEKMVILDFFPYPSGVGLHVGHTLGYIATDIYSRFQRLKGKNVLHSMGYDAFGLPAEQFAIENNEHPSVITYKNIENIKSQLNFLGLDHDNERTFNTTNIDYYKWTQFIFLRLYNSYFDKIEQKAKPIENLIEKLKNEGKSQNEIDIIIKSSRLAYLDEIKVNWCPKLGTVLSNEEVIGGLSERGSYPVFQKPLKQWVLKITEYSQRLVNNLDLLDWPESVKEMQRNWIGISNGHEIFFQCNNGEVLKVYTTRLETLNGVVSLCISREHPKLNQFFDIMKVSEIEKLPEKFKGIKSKITAFHPISNQKIAIFVADYVLPYGTFAVMSVPAHDDRDYNFAKENNLDIVPVIAPDSIYLNQNNVILEDYKNNTSQYPCYSGKNALLNGNTIEQEIIKLEQNTYFIEKKQYTKLRDWIFSRQRYWGEPFPIVLDKNGEPYSLEDEALPVELPYLEKIKAESVGDTVYKPLDDCIEWKNVKFIKLDNGKVRVIKDDSESQGKEIFEGTRETNTMPNWAGSCWYYLRYMDNKNDKEFIGTEAKNYWEKPKKIGAVDLYLGGTEHAVLHLMYARFWHMVLYDLGYLNSPEPFQKLFNQGMILGPSYKNEAGKYFSYKNVEKRGDDWFSKDTNEKLEQNIGKIGKRYKNGVTPEEVCAEYSIDGLRLFMMHLGPLDQSKPWDYTAIKGMVRLLDNVYNLQFEANYEDSEKIKYEFNMMLSKINSDFEVLKFNTAISAFIIFVNFLNKEKCKLSLVLYKRLLIILSPMAVHLCEYLYGKIDIKNRLDSIVNESWPKLYQNVNYSENTVNLVITIDGKKPIECLVQAFINKEEVSKFVENYCFERSIIFNKIIVFFNKNSWYSNIVTL